MRKIASTYIIICSLFALSACDRFLDITPTGKVIAKTAEEYRALLTYEYKYFPKDRALLALRSDELSLAASYTSDLDYESFFDLWRWNDDAPMTTTASFGWRRYYHAVYIANYVIARQSEITQGTADEVEQLVGEAYMLRAYSLFILANLYAVPYTSVAPEQTRGVPVLLEADVDAVPGSSSLAEVYAQVLRDVDEAARHLRVETWELGKNYRFNTLSAACLRARTCLYMGDWQGALEASQAVLAVRSELEDFRSAASALPTLYTSVENIVALEQNMPAAYATIGRPDAAFLNLYSTGDLRRTKFYRRVTASVSTLQKGGTDEFACTFRTAEFYLTAAEACARLGDVQGAADYLSPLLEKRYTADALPARLAAVQAMDAAELTAEILDERARELAFEGHRWFDLRRTTMPALSKAYGSETYRLGEGDSRYTLRFPTEAVEANPAIELWNLPVAAE